MNERRNIGIRINASACATVLIGMSAGSVLMWAGFGQSMVRSRIALSSPKTTAAITANGARVAGFFDGVKPDPRFTVRSLEAHQHPPSACQQRTRRLSWIDRLMGVRVVYAQCMGGGSCTGNYWYSAQYTCQRNLPAGCTGATLYTSEYGGGSYYNGFCSCCMYCPKPTNCGTIYPICNNGAT